MAYRAFETSEISRRSLFRFGAYGAAGAALATMPLGRSLLAQSAAEDWPNLARMAQTYVSEGKVANMMMTFGWGADEAIQSVGGGTLAMGGSAQVDENTLYRIYSMSKPITGMATMMLIDDGVLGLDQPLHEILPAFRDMQVLVDPEGPLENTEPAKRAITIRHLLTHTAGIGYTIVSKGPLLAAYAENGIIGGRLSRFPIPGLPNAEPAPGLEAFADRLAALPLAYQPGTKWSYSNSIDLLGRVIEVASGMEFEAFLKTRLFEPLGMNSTYFQVPESDKHRLADNYGILNGTVLPLDLGSNSIFLDAPKMPAGGGDLVSSARDYDRFLNMLLNYGKLGRERVMSESAVRVGVSNLIPATVDLTGSSMEGQGHGAGGRSFDGTFGWGGAAGTLGAVDYNRGLRTGLWTQYMPSNSYPVRSEFRAALDADLAARDARTPA